MGFYSNRILPWMIETGCGGPETRKQRERVVPLAEGVVLELGLGTGHNLAHYDPDRVTLVKGLEPSRAMLKRAKPRIDEAAVPVEVLVAGAERIPVEDGSVDTVVSTYTLCTVPDAEAALQECIRVLKPGGSLVFCEHGESPEDSVRKWQGRVNPLWKRLAGGCNVNRPIPSLIESAGFSVGELETGYVKGAPKVGGYEYWGSATPTR